MKYLCLVLIYSINFFLLIECPSVQGDSTISQPRLQDPIGQTNKADTNEYIEDEFPKVLRLFPQNKLENQLTKLAAGENNNSPQSSNDKEEKPGEDKPFFCQQHRCNKGAKLNFNFTEDHRSNTHKKDDKKCFELNKQL